MLGRNVLKPYNRISWQNWIHPLSQTFGSRKASRTSFQSNSSLPMYWLLSAARRFIICFCSAERNGAVLGSFGRPNQIARTHVMLNIPSIIYTHLYLSAVDQLNTQAHTSNQRILQLRPSGVERRPRVLQMLLTEPHRQTDKTPSSPSHLSCRS